jgi:hypothetical protein
MNRLLAGALLGLLSFATAQEPPKEAPAAAQGPGAELLARCDLDKDGQVSWEEYQKVKSGFARLDADGNGFVTREEIAKVAAERQQRMRKAMRRHRMRGFRGEPGMRGRMQGGFGPQWGGRGFGRGPGPQGPRWQHGGRGRWWGPGGPPEDAPRPRR